MRTRWTNGEMEDILIQLNDRSYLFKKYRFLRDENGLVLLGSGGYADVYEMECNDGSGERVALKVLGFGTKHIDSEEFRKSVEIQKDLSLWQNDVVKIVDYTELRVHIDEDSVVLRVERIQGEEGIGSEGNCLNLQFVLMEKLVPVLTMDRAGKPQLYPEKLAAFDEAEIMRFSHNIGKALERAHNKNLLHRDVKLENVFYDEKKNVYKLGDFGIAKMTDDGMASTVAFTKGYGAPEVVGAMNERYDNTADIYSFGMMLYLLLNRLKFPDSDNYNVNVSLQYSKGYVFPEPEYTGGGLNDIVEVMCRFDPNERYQSMEQVLNEIEGILIGEDIKYKKENQKATYVAGMLCCLAGIVMWKLTHMPEMLLNIDVWWYVYLGVGGYVYWLNLRKKKHTGLSLVMLCFGVSLLFFKEFAWWKLVLVIGISLSTESFAGVAAGGVVIVDVLSQVMQRYSMIYVTMKEFNWIALLLLSFATVLFIQYLFFGERDLKMYYMYFKRKRYWVMVCAIYGMLLLSGLVYRYMEEWKTLDFWLLSAWKEMAGRYNLILLGLCGVGVSAGWLVREKVLRIVNVRREN